MGTVRLNHEGLTRSSSQLKHEGEQLETLINSMQHIVNELTQSWEGQAANAYAQQFHDLKPGLMQTRQLVATIASQIDQTLQQMNDLDQQIASKLR